MPSELPKPTIKGVFVNAHIRALKNEKGEDGVGELEKRFGRKIEFGNNEDVLVRDEVEIIEHCLDILSNTKISAENREFEAGKLHFRNFITTPLAKVIVPFFKNSFKTVLLNANNIAGHVFRGVNFDSKEISDNTVEVKLKNNDYPIDHFKGLFYEWMTYSGLKGNVTTSQKDGVYKYRISWD